MKRQMTLQQPLLSTKVLSYIKYNDTWIWKIILQSFFTQKLSWDGNGNKYLGHILPLVSQCQSVSGKPGGTTQE